MSHIKELAESAARAGADVLRGHAGAISGLRTKSGTADLVSAADVAAGIAIVRMISERMEGARFVVEEPEVCVAVGAPAGSLEHDQVWVIDPLDGTTSFVHGYPCWSVSIALLREGTPAVGVVYNVPADELISAELGQGATCDGASLTCTGAATIEEALLATGFPYDRAAGLDRQLRILERLLRPAHDIRRDGSAAIDLCHVATGRVDGFWETALRPWDTAAGTLIVTESGGSVTDFSGMPWTPGTRDVIAANPTLHAVLLDAIARVEGR
jgi:myo-inositol-1(or 4)-monophosphatase